MDKDEIYSFQIEVFDPRSGRTWYSEEIKKNYYELEHFTNNITHNESGISFYLEKENKEVIFSRKLLSKMVVSIFYDEEEE